MSFVTRGPAQRLLRSRPPARSGLALLAAAALVAALLPLSGATTPALAASGLHVSKLRVNTFDNPIGLSDRAPILGWQVSGVAGNGPASRQSAYEIRVATSVPKLGTPDIWDSGRVASASSNNVTYAGAPLQARQALVWEVRVWDGNGDASSWSPPGRWEMGLLTNADWSAKWIENPDYTYATNGVPNPLPIFGKAFSASGTIAKARLYITGLGQYAANLNGQPVGDAVLEPGETSFYAEVDYRTYDVTGLLKQGSNVLGIETGSGEYDRVITPGRYFFQNNPEPVYGTPKVIAQLELTYANGSRQTIATDGSWLTELGPTTYSGWWAGEDYDARRIAPNWTSSAGNLTGPGWRSAGVATLSPTTYPQDTTPLVANPRPPVTVATEAHPLAINQITRAPLRTTLIAPAAAGDTNLMLDSLVGVNPGDTLTVGSDTRKIVVVGAPAGSPTTLFSNAAAGDTNVKVGSVSGFFVGQQALIDTGASLERAVVSAIGTAGSATALSAAAAAGATNIKVASVSNLAVGDTLAVDTGANLETVTITSVGTSGSGGTGVGITPAFTLAHAAGAAIRDQSKPGTGITLSAPLATAHSIGATARAAGTGVSLDSGLSSAQVFGTAVTVTYGPTYVLDFGKNYAGLPKVTVSGPAGSTVTMIPAETVNSDGTINVSSTGARPPASQILYRYTLSGNGTETWHSQFTYNGFRYLQVTGLASAPTADTVTELVTHASNAETATFDSASDLLNSIYAMTKLSLENNMQSVLTDCPDREKGPYTGDNLHNIDTELTLFDMQAFQGQLVANMRTAQRPVPFDSDFPGMIANIAPEYHFVPPFAFGTTWFLDEPNWGGAVIMIPWNLYEVYGDTKVMAANYDAMVKWLDWEATTKAANGGNIKGLGDWSAAQSTTPAQAIIDYGYYRGASTMAKIAQLLGKSADAATYSALAASLKDEYNTKYLHTDTSGHAWYANNTEASNAAALDAGLVPDQYHQAVVDSLVAAVVNYGYRIGTGSVGIGPLFRALHAAGRDDVIYQMVTNPASPGYAYLVNTGHTTLSENLSGGGSQDHHFLGEVDSWFVHGLAGIEQAPDTVGYKSLLIKPALVGDLAGASGTYATPAGDVTSAWTRIGTRISLNVSVPNNVSATVSLPTTSTMQSYRASGNGGAVFVGIQDGREIWTVGAGQTHFQPR